ncbi:hypothetical protein LCGC14_0890620 [marine sediment metagenome]|uniref:Uncharacterized protein n=1 Tax=marine sediment metagenome TaxID=412755 RepID=A0A0F9NZF4_9ZZZZ
MNKTNAAIIVIDSGSLLKMLDFEGGKIHIIGFSPDGLWGPHAIEMVIEHPDLNKVEDGYVLTRIIPEYQYTGTVVERVNPPKRTPEGGE